MRRMSDNLYRRTVLTVLQTSDRRLVHIINNNNNKIGGEIGGTWMGFKKRVREHAKVTG